MPILRKLAFLFFLFAYETAFSAPKNIIQAYDLGVICDGKYDNTAEFDKIFKNEIKESSIIFPPGTCVFRKPISILMNRSSISGAGSAATILLYDGEDLKSDIIFVKDSYGSEIKDFGLWSTKKRVSGTALHVMRSSYINISNMHINNFQTKNNNFWNSLWIDQPNFVTVTNLYLQSQNDALLLSARGVGTPYQYDVFIGHSKLSDSKTGLHVAGGIDNIHIQESEITSNMNNFIDDNSSFPAVNQEIYLDSGSVFDQSYSDNIVINDKFCNRDNYGMVFVSGVVTNSKHGNGIIVKNFPNCELSIRSPLISKNNIDGIALYDKTSYVSISSSVFISDNKRYGIYYKKNSDRVNINAVFINNKKSIQTTND